MAPRKRQAPASAPAAARLSITVTRSASAEQLLASQKGLALAKITAPPPERAIVNNAKLRANTQNILTIIKAARPKNTASAYKPKQEEFQQFCQQKHYQDGKTVIENKLLLFLIEEVVNWPLQSQSKKAGEDVPLSET